MSDTATASDVKTQPKTVEQYREELLTSFLQCLQETVDQIDNLPYKQVVDEPEIGSFRKKVNDFRAELSQRKRLGVTTLSRGVAIVQRSLDLGDEV